jgi:multicomponent Na+:H+ antiporter subunit D
MADHRAYTAWVLHGVHVPLPAEPSDRASVTEVMISCGGIVLALVLAALGLFGRPLREALPAALRDSGRAVVVTVRGAHSGHIGDYIAWWTAGAASFGAVCVLFLR